MDISHDGSSMQCGSSKAVAAACSVARVGELCRAVMVGTHKGRCRGTGGQGFWGVHASSLLCVCFTATPLRCRLGPRLWGQPAAARQSRAPN